MTKAEFKGRLLALIEEYAAGGDVVETCESDAEPASAFDDVLEGTTVELREYRIDDDRVLHTDTTIFDF